MINALVELYRVLIVLIGIASVIAFLAMASEGPVGLLMALIYSIPVIIGLGISATLISIRDNTVNDFGQLRASVEAFDAD